MNYYVLVLGLLVVFSPVFVFVGFMVFNEMLPHRCSNCGLRSNDVWSLNCGAVGSMASGYTLWFCEDYVSCFARSGSRPPGMQPNYETLRRNLKAMRRGR